MHLRQLLLALFLLALLAGSGSDVFANVDLLYFRAESSSDVITLVWETETELDNLGFHLWRSQTANQANAVRINDTIIPSQVGGQPIGAIYEYPDANVQEQVNYFYWLESVDINGFSQFHGPVQASLGSGNPISTQPPGGGGLPEPTSTNAAPPANTATPNITPPPIEASATRPNPTATTANNSTNPTAAPPLPTTNNTSVTSSAPPVNTVPSTPAQPTDSIATGAEGQLEPSESMPDTPAVTPIASPASSSIASNNNAAPTQPTATFIASEDYAPIGAQPPAAESAAQDAVPAENTPSSDNGRSRVAVIALVIGLSLTAVGGFALWSLGRRDAGSYE